MASSKERKLPSPEALALLYLRSERGWTQGELAAHLGSADRAQISRYETGEKRLHRGKLAAFAAALGHPPEAVDALLGIHRWLQPSALAEPASPMALTLEERRSVDRTALAAADVFREEVQQELRRKKRERKADAARRKARDLWLRLKAAPRQDQRDLVTVMPAFQDWALAMHVCEASVRAAAHRPEDALHLAELAVLIASKSPGPEGWRSRLEGYCWAHLANARRVANDYPGADKTFAHALKLWKSGATSAPDLLPEWRMFDLEASLRREQQRFQEALELLNKAREHVGTSPAAIARLLLQKEHVLEQIGDVQSALDALLEATPFAEAAQDPRLLFALLFKTVNNFCHLGRYREAMDGLVQVRDLALQQRNELDLIRVVWLEARIEAGRGHRKEALTKLEQIRRDLMSRELPYDAARASLELAILYLKEDRPQAVKALALEMAPTFQSQGIHREAIAALKLFYDAAIKETATLDLIQQVLAIVRKTRRPASPP